jgi:cell wall-associated NlpC family hydrolase
MMPRAAAAVFFALLIPLWSGACASTGGAPRPFPLPGGSSAAAPPRSGERARGSSGVDGYAVTSTALALRGAPYRTGGTDPRQGFDCSGFTQYVFAQYGLALPREVRDQYRIGVAIAPDEVAPGDLLFFWTSSRGPSHVGIALGGDEFIHAPSSNGVVRVERLSAAYWSKRFLAAHRIK